MNKQSQLPAAGIPHYSTILSFHHSKSMRWCKTKPICPGIGFQGSGISGLTADPRPLTPELSCETNPISGWGKMKLTAVAANGYRSFWAFAGRAKQSQFPAIMPIGRSAFPGGPLCKTKPIPGGAGWDGAAGAWDEGQMMQNEPNFRLRRRVEARGTGTAGFSPRPSPLRPAALRGGNHHQLLDAGWSGSERPPRCLARNFSAAA